jgi:alpha-mannosidase
VKLQQQTVELLLQPLNTQNYQHSFVISELERDSNNRMPRKTPIQVTTKDKKMEVVVFNSLAQERIEIVLLRVTKPNVKVTDANGNELQYQINPVFNVSEHHDTQSRKVFVSTREFELMFLAKLPALSLTVFTVSYHNETKDKIATIYCDECKDDSPYNENELIPFNIHPKSTGDIQVANAQMRLLFDGQTGFLKSITNKRSMGRSIQMEIQFGAYKSAQFHSGAYLFRTESFDQKNAEKDVFEYYKDSKIMITTGAIASDVTVIHGALLAHTVRIFKTQTHLDRAIYIENDVDFESPPKNRETEMFMRFVTSIENGDDPIFYSDLNGFQWLPRQKVPQIGIEGNYYPITTSAFIQDKQMRLTVMTTHAQGAASLEPGYLEVMLDRRTLYDDYRGMGEGVVDSRLMRHQFWLTLETFDDIQKSEKAFNVPSLHAQHLSLALNYPVNTFFIEKYDENQQIEIVKNVPMLNYQLPCDLHIVNLRTLTEKNLPLFPSRSALFITHRFGYDCRLSDSDESDSYINFCMKSKGKFSGLELLKDIELDEVQRTTLTALKSLGQIKSFNDDSTIEAMEIRTFNMTFV